MRHPLLLISLAFLTAPALAQQVQVERDTRPPIAPDIREDDSRLKVQRGDFVAVPIPISSPTFGTGLSRDKGADGTEGTADDRVTVGWSTWHGGIWYSHVTTPVLIGFDEWHHLGFAWGGPNDNFEVWVDGVLRASHDVPPSGAWGTSTLGGLGSAYNFALGEIHERRFGNSTVHGIMFADLEIWDEYRALGATQSQNPSSVPEPATLALLGLGLVGIGLGRRRRR